MPSMKAIWLLNIYAVERGGGGGGVRLFISVTNQHFLSCVINYD